ncbi:MAG: SPOR domain-containing protein [Candidatus Tectomicrobia bacterium]|nr:SPOR domain-containing protein [Candidatus Tectomicrobia bacterium]
MAYPRGEPPEPRLIRLTLTKLQLGLLVVGLAALLTGAFSLGLVMGDRERGERAAAGAAGRTTTVKLEPQPASSPDPRFYKELTAPAKPPQEAPLAPIRLPDGKEPPAPPAREAAPQAEQELPAVPREEPRPPASAPQGPDGTAQAAERSFSKDGPPRFTIQVLSVKEADRAERVLRDLIGKGIPAFIERADLGERGVWHRVRVGRFWDRGAAERTLEELRRKAVRGGSVISL